MKRFFSGSFLRTTFFIIAFASFPAIAIVFFTGLERNTVALHQAQTQAINAVHAVSRIQSTLTASAYTLLVTLGQMDFVHSPDSDLTDFLDRLNYSHPAFTDIFLVDEDGYIIASKSGTIPSIRVIDRGYFARARQHEVFVAGDVIYSRLSKMPIFHFGYKMRPVNGHSLTLVTGVQLSYYRVLLQELSLPQGATLYIADMKGRVAVSLPQEEMYATLPESVEIALARHSGREGVFLFTHAGATSLVAYQRIPLSVGSGEDYLQVVLTIPEQMVLSGLQATQWRNISLLGLALAGMALLSMAFVLGILLPPIKNMLSAARSYATGSFSARLPDHGPTRELNELAESMNSMAEAIEKREEDLIKARDTAELASKSKGEFLANMSHEIRTPMNAVIGMAYLALKSDLSPQQRGYVTKIHEAASDLLRVINDILELSKLDAGKLGMESVAFSLRDIFADNQRHFSNTAKNKGLSLRFSIAPNVPRNLVGDPLRLGQILGHLLDNAVRYTENGSITVSCVLDELVGTQAGLCISIKDSGSGMSAPKVTALQRLFASDATPVPDKPPSQSNGLGLLLAHKLAQAMGGHLAVDSVPGEGSTFYIHLRFGMRSGSRVAGTRMLSGLRVLAVDDEPVSLSILKELLENFGMRVVTEESPEQGLALLQRADETDAPFDLVILDWRMPVMDGVELTRRIKDGPPLNHPPAIIMLSAYGWQGITLQAETAGVDSFLHKPINESVLLDTIMNLLGPQSAKDHLDAETESAKPKLLEGLPVLVVEDNIVNQQVAQEILAEGGVRVTLAENGQKAVSLFDETAASPPFAIVLMDLQMPVMDGYEATRRLRQLSTPWAADLPIIAMTAHSRSSEESAYREAGLDDHVSKPIDVDELFNTLRRWLPPLPVEEEKEKAFIQEFYSKAARNDPATGHAFAQTEAILAEHLHEGRTLLLRMLVEEGKYREAAAFLERLNSVTRGVTGGSLYDIPQES